ncbi:universal stress protein [Sphingomonas sp.]|uniref:universal stress protein n=1 Tax=Sphingomonas sp. TaxID=28214 RepID=UPI0025D3EC71|nr:universal stress protein [Sphingomonas sp.]
MLNILVPVSDASDDGQSGRVRVAIEIARALTARLTVIVEGQFALAGGDWSGPPPCATPQQEAFSPVPEQLADLLDRSAIRWGWIERPGGWREVSHQVGTGWLVAAPPTNAADGIGGAVDIEEALIQHRLAMVTVPPNLRSFEVRGHALVLWDGSREAGHALAAAVPLLRVASRVTLLEIDDGTLATLGCQALDLLAARGIAATLSYVKSDGRGAARIALDEIAARSPDYAVMGAFDPPSWMARLSGEVTGELIRHSPVPLFLKH